MLKTVIMMILAFFTGTLVFGQTSKKSAEYKKRTGPTSQKRMVQCKEPQSVMPIAINEVLEDWQSSMGVMVDAALQHRCRYRVRCRKDGSDDPACRNIPPSYDYLRRFHRVCQEEKINSDSELCIQLLPLSMSRKYP